MTQYLIATSVLEAIVRGSLENDERLRIHSPCPDAHPSRGGRCRRDECRVSVQLDARMGSTCPPWPPACGRPLQRP